MASPLINFVHWNLFFVKVAASKSIIHAFKCRLLWLCRDLLSRLFSHLSNFQTHQVAEPWPRPTADLGRPRRCQTNLHQQCRNQPMATHYLPNRTRLRNIYNVPPCNWKTGSASSRARVWRQVNAGRRLFVRCHGNISCCSRSSHGVITLGIAMGTSILGDPRQELSLNICLQVGVIFCKTIIHNNFILSGHLHLAASYQSPEIIVGTLN